MGTGRGMTPDKCPRSSSEEAVHEPSRQRQCRPATLPLVPLTNCGCRPQGSVELHQVVIKEKLPWSGVSFVTR
jgi:hypothetical protein